MKQLDERGIPGTFVVTNAFEDAAAAQSRSLGFEASIVWVDHPIQNRTPEELENLAEQAIASILSQITAGDTTGS